MFLFIFILCMMDIRIPDSTRFVGFPYSHLLATPVIRFYNIFLLTLVLLNYFPKYFLIGYFSHILLALCMV